MTRTYQYTVNFEQDEDGVYIATVPALPGCHSFGRTLDEAEKNIQEAIEGHLEARLKAGDPIPIEEAPSVPLSKPIQVSLSA
ncbi:MAG: type II toxin-antitoxin system HicB family antitoxin [bacterium]